MDLYLDSVGYWRIRDTAKLAVSEVTVRRD